MNYGLELHREHESWMPIIEKHHGRGLCIKDAR